jgi:hypothetical protein
VELQLPQELPPELAAIWLSMLKSSFARDTNFEIARFEGVLQRGHSQSSLLFDIGLSCSNFSLQLGQLYS